MEQEFEKWVVSISKEYKQSQIKAAVKVNSELIAFYYRFGKEISESSFKNEYGSSFYKTLSEELRKKIPNSHGFSPRNLAYIESFYKIYRKILQQVVAKFPQAIEDSENIEESNVSIQFIKQLSMVPWGHHRIIIDKSNGNIYKAWFYVVKTIANNWSRSVLDMQISSKLFEREGKAIANFSIVLPKEKSLIAQQITKCPYYFDFAEIRDDYNEKELKNALVDNVKSLLLELGTGFSFVEQEYRLCVGKSEFYIDLLFYNIPLHCYVVVEVKTTKFKPEYLGQLSFYVSAIDHDIKTKLDNKTIGLLICKEKDNVVVQYALDNFTIPLGISSFELSKMLPNDIKSKLPTIEELEDELKRKGNK